jgi:glutamate-1-semialdehyde 2,1-aminomutase
MAVVPALDRRRLGELHEREFARLRERTRKSEALFRRARRVLAGGVASSYQLHDPWPVHIIRGEGSHLQDADGNEYLDFHNGFGSMVQGHAHPAILEAVSKRHTHGSHFGAPTEEAISVAEELERRFVLPRWRFTNSGTESTMSAIRLARALTGRDDVVKVFGAYHGHHDAVMASLGVPYEQIGPAHALPSLPWGAGIPAATLKQVHTVHFNDVDALERRVAGAGRKPACLIVEAVMTGIGIVLPQPGYLEAARDITRRHGVVLIFDEVKTGLTIAPGGAVERFGVQPDIVTLAKALGGGLPSGAIGMSAEVARVVEDGSVHHVGTFNGNPLAMAATHASLTEILTPPACERLEALNQRLTAGIEAAIAEHGLPFHTAAVGSKGCVRFGPEPVVDYESYKRRHDSELSELAWLWAMNRGLFLTPGRELEWHLSVAHTEDEIDRYVEAFAALASALSPAD